MRSCASSTPSPSGAAWSRAGRVVVHGGGNTATDAARAAHDVEVDEGVMRLSTIWQADGGKVALARMELDELDTWYDADTPRTARPQLDLARRQPTFEEVTGGLDESTAPFEARRLSCGNRFPLDGRCGASPDDAVRELDEPGPYAYAIDLENCKGCGLCAAECPCGAIAMEPETT